MTAGQPDASYRWQAPFEAALSGAFVGRGVAGPTYANVAVGGDTTADMLARVPTTIAAAPDHLVVMCGVNDCYDHGGTPIPPATSAANVASYLAAVRAALPDCVIHWSESLWFASEQRPDGIGPHDAAVQATMAAIKPVVQAAAGCEWWGIRDRIWTFYSDAYNPGNLVDGAMTQVDGTHPSKTAGQQAISNANFDYVTIGI